MEGKKLVDLHFHSCYSDGMVDVPGIIKEAKKREVVGALALTDHNIGKGVPEFIVACKEAGILALEGVEIYASFAEHEWSWDESKCGPMPDVTILGRKLNWDEFKRYQQKLIQYWFEYWLPETLKRLRQVGLIVPELSKEEMWEQIKDSGVPRVIHHDVPENPQNWPKILEVCQKHYPNLTADQVKAQPDEWLTRGFYDIGRPAYVLRVMDGWTVRSAVELAEAMGGVLFAAHPGGNFGNWTDKHLEFFVRQGGKGIEIWQYYHKPEQIQKFKDFAREHNLLVSGGSDWHGPQKKPTLGCWDKPENQTPHEVFGTLMERLPS